MPDTPSSTATNDTPILGQASADAVKQGAEGSTTEVKTDAQEQVKTADGKSTDQKQDAKVDEKKDGKVDEKTDVKKDEGVPEKYEFVAPEGVVLHPEATAEFQTLAQELKLNKASAQKIVDVATKHFGKEGEKMAQAEADAWKEANTKWANECKTDKEFGGEKFEESRTHITRALIKFAGADVAEVNKVLNTGWGNHPALFRTFARIGKAMAEDSFVDGAGASSQMSAADKIYGKSPARK